MKLNNQLFLPGDSYNGKAVLLLHGISSGCAQMIPMGKMLNDYGYAVFCANLAGHGTYPQDLLHTDFENLIEKADYDFSLLKREYDQVYVLGLSLGGAVTLALASDRSDLAGIIPVSAPVITMAGNFATADYPPEQVFFHRELSGKQGIARRYHIHYEEIAIHIFKELPRLVSFLNESGRLEKIDCPALVAQAQDDDMVDPRSCHEIFRRISSAQKVLYNPVSGGHNLTFNEGRFDLMKAAVSFLDPF